MHRQHAIRQETGFDDLTELPPGAGPTRISRRRLTWLMLAGGATALAGGAALAASLDSARAHHTEQPYTVTKSARMRSGPSARHRVIATIQPGEIFTLNAQERNGYYSISFQGRIGWVKAALVVEAGQPGGTGTAKVDLNLRAEPSLSAPVLLVIPAGGVVRLGDQLANGFRLVTYAGTTGWAWDAYLSY